jgi:putative membrane protein
MIFPTPRVQRCSAVFVYRNIMLNRFDLKRFILRLSINILAILAAVTIVPGIHLDGPWWGLAVVAAIFGLVNTAIRPLLTLLTLPFVIVTIGLFLLVINALMLYVTSALASAFGINFIIDGLGWAILGALIVNLVSGVLGILSGDSRIRFQVVRGRRDE